MQQNIRNMVKEIIDDKVIIFSAKSLLIDIFYNEEK